MQKNPYCKQLEKPLLQHLVFVFNATNGWSLFAYWLGKSQRGPYFELTNQTNCRYACTSWGIGKEVNNDVKRDEIGALVKEMMEGEGNEAKDSRMEEESRRSFKYRGLILQEF